MKIDFRQLHKSINDGTTIISIISFSFLYARISNEYTGLEAGANVCLLLADVGLIVIQLDVENAMQQKNKDSCVLELDDLAVVIIYEAQTHKQ